jgi:hypothetical protein
VIRRRPDNKDPLKVLKGLTDIENIRKNGDHYKKVVDLHVGVAHVPSGADEHAEAALDPQPAAVARHLRSII